MGGGERILVILQTCRMHSGYFANMKDAFWSLCQHDRYNLVILPTLRMHFGYFFAKIGDAFGQFANMVVAFWLFC